MSHSTRRPSASLLRLFAGLSLLLLVGTAAAAARKAATVAKSARPAKKKTAAPAAQAPGDRVLLDITRHRRKVIWPDGRVRTTVTYTQN